MSNRKNKLTYQPLYPSGFHLINESEIESVFVTGVESSRRKFLSSQLRLFIHKLESLGVKGDLWIDGSFSTKNHEPMDIDLLLIVSRVVLSAMNDDALTELSYMASKEGREYVRTKWSCDFYVINSSEIGRRSYYEDLYSRNPDISNRKGIPVIQI